jgi:hypothetical protein
MIVAMLRDRLAWLCGGACLLSMVIALATALRWRAVWRAGWLAAVPAAKFQQRRAHWALLGQRAMVGALLFGLAVARLRQVPGFAAIAGQPLLSVAAIPAAGWIGVWMAAMLVARAESLAAILDRHRSRPAAKFSPRRAPGSLAAWQRAAIGRPRAGIVAALVLLLVPGGESAQSLAMLGLAGISASLLLTAWRQSTAVIVRASALLRPQPLPGRRLLRQTVAIPAAIAGFGAAFCIAVLCALGLPVAIAGLMLVAIWAIALLHLACVCAWRAMPRRIAGSFSFMAILLGLFLQIYPPMLPLIWGVAMAVSSRRAWRQ